MSSMTWQEWTDLGDLKAIRLTTVCAANGHLYLFALKPPYRYELYKARQSGTEPFTWSDWVKERGDCGHLLSAVRGADDRVLLFWQAYNGAIYVTRESGPGTMSFSGAQGLANNPLEMVATTLADGRVICLFVNAQHQVVAKAEVAPGSGTFAQSFTDLGHWIKDLTVAHEWNRRLKLFGIGSDQTLQHLGEESTGFGEGEWESLGGSLTKIAAASHEGRICVFGVGTDGALWELSNDGPGRALGRWRHHGGRICEVDVTFDAGGEPVVAAVDDGNRLWICTPGYKTPDLAQITQGDALRMTITGLGLAGVTDIELRARDGSFVSIFESIQEATSEMLHLVLPGSHSLALEPGPYDYTLRLTGAQNHRSHTIDGAIHVMPANDAPEIDSIGFESPQPAPNCWAQGDLVNARILGANLANATDVLRDGVSIFAGKDPLDPTSPVRFIDRSDYRQLVLAFSPAWTRDRPPGELRFALKVVGRDGHHSATLHAMATVLEAPPQTPKITRMAIRPAGATPPETPPAEDVYAQGDDLVLTIEGEGLGEPQDVVFSDGRSVLAEPATEIITVQSNHQMLVIAMGAAATRAHSPGSRPFTIGVISSQGYRSALFSRDTKVEKVADVTPCIDAVSITPVGTGTRDSWTPGDALQITIVGANLQGAQDVRLDEGSSLLDAHTTIVTDQGSATTLTISMGSERTVGHAPGRMALTFIVVGALGNYSNAHGFEGFVCPHADAPRMRSVAEAPAG